MRNSAACCLAMAAAAAWPIADVVAANSTSDTSYYDLAGWFFGILLLIVIVTVVTGVFLGSIRRSTAVITPLSILFFAYALFAHGIDALSAGLNRQLSPFWTFAAVFATASVWLCRSTTRSENSRFLILVAPFLLGSTCVVITAQSIKASHVTTPSLPTTRFIQRPNVYHFLFDGMGRREIIRSKLGVDVGDVSSTLKKLGFIVPDNVVAQYPTTWQSINSFMSGGATKGEMSQPDIVSSYAVHTFKTNGYHFVQYGEVFNFAACTGLEDLCLSSYTAGLSEFSVTMFKRTPIYTLARRLILSRTSSRHLVENLNHIAGTAVTRPSFVFSYMVPPHPPFIFAKTCSADQRDFNDFRAWRRASVDRYATAYKCVVAAASLAIRTIIARDPSSIIIVSGDHGTMFGQVGRAKDGWTPGVLEERLPVFLAIRGPSRCAEFITTIRRLSQTYPSIFDCLSQK